MYSYTIIQWLFFFYFYCFFGWCFESCYVSLKSKRWVNRGFMKGPFLPLYGSGAILLLVVSKPFIGHWWAVYIAGCIGATILEYFTGVAMEALFKVRYWDYSNQPFNFQGHICLGCSLAWGGLTLLMNYVIHKPVEKLVLAIPDNILLKPGKLTREEFEIMKTHTTKGCEILERFKQEDSDYYRYCYDICRYHHERYDGKGYPRGLKGEGIPLLGRILAVCDSFDAMISKRSYKEALSVEYAMGELEKNKGTQFDPKAADAFIELIKEGKVPL